MVIIQLRQLDYRGIELAKMRKATGKAEKQENYREYLNQQIEELLLIADSHDAGALTRKLKEIIPEFSPQPIGDLPAGQPSNGNGRGLELEAV